MLWPKPGPRGLGAIAAEGDLLKPGAALARPAPTPGSYNCRLIKLGSTTRRQPAFEKFKPFFCYVEVENNLLTIVKQTGSERPAGRLWEDDNPFRLIYLGSLALGDEQKPRAYGDDPNVTWPGCLSGSDRSNGAWSSRGRAARRSSTCLSSRRSTNSPSKTWRLADPEEVRAHLIAAAAAGHALTYSELLERLGYNFSRPKMRALCVVLGAVDDKAEARGEPELAVLVVRQSDGLPGAGLVGRGRGRKAWPCGIMGRAEGAQIGRQVAEKAAFDYWADRLGRWAACAKGAR